MNELKIEDDIPTSARLLVERNDKDQDGRLSFTEFQSILMRFGVVIKSSELGLSLPSGYRTIDSFKPSTRTNIKAVLEAAISNERNLDYLRELSKKVKN